jgi:hypothetical protein
MRGQFEFIFFWSRVVSGTGQTLSSMDLVKGFLKIGPRWSAFYNLLELEHL